VTEDPRRAIVEVMARLGRETQLHIDERHRHFKITDAVIVTISLLLVVLAVFNVYYVRVLYKDLDVTVRNMESMHQKLVDVEDDMTVITERFGRFDQHMTHMETINTTITSMASSLPKVREDMSLMAADMGIIDQDMALVRQAMVNIDQKMQHMTGGVSIMRTNVWQLAKPMGMMNSILP